jgi:hypothetical protein
MCTGLMSPAKLCYTQVSSLGKAVSVLGCIGTGDGREAGAAFFGRGTSLCRFCMLSKLLALHQLPQQCTWVPVQHPSRWHNHVITMLTAPLHESRDYSCTLLCISGVAAHVLCCACTQALSATPCSTRLCRQLLRTHLRCRSGLQPLRLCASRASAGSSPWP